MHQTLRMCKTYVTSQKCICLWLNFIVAYCCLVFEEVQLITISLMNLVKDLFCFLSVDAAWTESMDYSESSSSSHTPMASSDCLSVPSSEHSPLMSEPNAFEGLNHQSESSHDSLRDGNIFQCQVLMEPLKSEQSPRKSSLDELPSLLLHDLQAFLHLGNLCSSHSNLEPDLAPASRSSAESSPTMVCSASKPSPILPTPAMRKERPPLGKCKFSVDSSLTELPAGSIKHPCSSHDACLSSPSIPSPSNSLGGPAHGSGCMVSPVHSPYSTFQQMPSPCTSYLVPPSSSQSGASLCHLSNNFTNITTSLPSVHSNNNNRGLCPFLHDNLHSAPLVIPSGFFCRG